MKRGTEMKLSHPGPASPASRRSARVAAILAILLLLGLGVFPKISRAAAEADQGKQVYERRCTGCHALDRNKEGPRLAGVYGRQAGAVGDFKYSPALRSAHFAWDEQKLEKWLTDTESVVEDNNMDFHVAKAEERAVIIRYLKSLSSPQSRNLAHNP
jgi:cytochrome c